MFKDTIHARFTKAVRATADINRAVMASRHEINLDCERVHKVRIVQPRKKYNQTAIALQRVQPPIPEMLFRAVAARGRAKRAINRRRTSAWLPRPFFPSFLTTDIVMDSCGGSCSVTAAAGLHGYEKYRQVQENSKSRRQHRIDNS